MTFFVGFSLSKSAVIRACSNFSNFMSHSIPTGYIPPGQPPRISSKTCPRGRDLAFESCPGAGISTRAAIFYTMKLKLQKNGVIKFLQVKTQKNKKKNKKPFSRFACFFNRIFLVYGSIFRFYCHTYLTKSLRSCPWLVYLKFSLGYGYRHPLFA